MGWDGGVWWVGGTLIVSTVTGGYLVISHFTQIIPITTHPKEFKHAKTLDDSKNVQNYAALSLSGPPPPRPPLSLPTPRPVPAPPLLSLAPAHNYCV